MTLPSWVIAALPVGLLLAALFFIWRYVRRGTSPVHRAAANGNVARLEQLLLASPDSIDKVDMIGFTPLQHAAYWGQQETAKLLLDRGANLTAGQGPSPLHHAAARGYETIVSLLLENGADVNAQSPADGSTPLHNAVINRHAGLARVLLAAGADIEAKTRSDWTACHFAAGNGDVAMMSVLLEHGANWQTLNAADQNPLEVAMTNGHKEIVQLVQQAQSQEQATTD